MTSQERVRSSLPSRLLMLLFLPLHTQKTGNETGEILYYREYASWVSSAFSLINMLPLLPTLPLMLLKLYWKMKYLFRGVGTGPEIRIQVPSLNGGL